MNNENDRYAEELIGSFNINDSVQIDDLKGAAKKFISIISLHCPAGRRKDIALTKVEEAAMMAVKSYFAG